MNALSECVLQVLMVGWRGAPGVKDEPQHGVQGRQTVEMLQSMEIETFVLAQEDETARQVLSSAVQVTPPSPT